jgi:hypothetical protein
VPVGLRLHADPFDGDELALDAKRWITPKQSAGQ